VLKLGVLLQVWFHVVGESHGFATIKAWAVSRISSDRNNNFSSTNLAFCFSSDNISHPPQTQAKPAQAMLP
jgi:hypothetical protein